MLNVDEDGYARCWNVDAGCNGREVTRPCGICGTPISTAEICEECADESDVDAFTTNWGT